MKKLLGDDIIYWIEKVDGRGRPEGLWDGVEIEVGGGVVLLDDGGGWWLVWLARLGEVASLVVRQELEILGGWRVLCGF